MTGGGGGHGREAEPQGAVVRGQTLERAADAEGRQQAQASACGRAQAAWPSVRGASSSGQSQRTGCTTKRRRCVARRGRAGRGVWEENEKSCEWCGAVEVRATPLNPFGPCLCCA